MRSICFRTISIVCSISCLLLSITLSSWFPFFRFRLAESWYPIAQLFPRPSC